MLGGLEHMVGFGTSKAPEKKEDEEEKEEEQKPPAEEQAKPTEDEKQKPPSKASLTVRAVVGAPCYAAEEVGSAGSGSAETAGQKAATLTGNNTTGEVPLLPPPLGTVGAVPAEKAAMVRRLAGAQVNCEAIAKGLELEEKLVKKILEQDETADTTPNSLTWEEGFSFPLVDPRMAKLEFGLNRGGEKDKPFGTGGYSVAGLLDCEENTAVVEVPVYKDGKEDQEVLAYVKVQLQLLVCEVDN